MTPCVRLTVEAKLVDEYLDERWLHRRRRRGDAFTLRAFVRLVPVDSTVAAKWPIATLPRLHVLQKFEHYLLCERGLALASIRLYGDAVGRFLEHAFGDSEVRLGEITAADVIRFVQLDAARLHHSKRAKVMTSALRSFLQYGRYLGDIRTDLHASVPAVANWSMAGIPRSISAAQVHSLLAQCDRRTGIGRRDYAVLLLLARLGLRAGEVVELTLDDLDWDKGAIRKTYPPGGCEDTAGSPDTAVRQGVGSIEGRGDAGGIAGIGRCANRSGCRPRNAARQG